MLQLEFVVELLMSDKNHAKEQPADVNVVGHMEVGSILGDPHAVSLKHVEVMGPKNTWTQCSLNYDYEEHTYKENHTDCITARKQETSSLGKKLLG